MDMFVFAERLKQCRKSKNISAIELGKVAGVRSATIHRYENAEFKSIKQSRLEAIANYLGVDSDYLVGNTDDKYGSKFLEKLTDNQYFEISNIINITKELISKENVVLDGKPVPKELLKPIYESLEITIELARRKNK